MVQLLADGLILQLLSVQFVWRSEVGRKPQAQRSSTMAADQKQKAGNLEGRQMDRSVERKKREMGERKRMMNGQMQL